MVKISEARSALPELKRLGEKESAKSILPAPKVATLIANPDCLCKKLFLFFALFAFFPFQNIFLSF